MLCLKSCFKNDRFSRILRKNYWGKNLLFQPRSVTPIFQPVIIFMFIIAEYQQAFQRATVLSTATNIESISVLLQMLFVVSASDSDWPQWQIGWKKSQNMSAISVQIPIFILIVMAKLSNRPIGNFFFLRCRILPLFAHHRTVCLLRQTLIQISQTERSDKLALELRDAIWAR